MTSGLLTASDAADTRAAVRQAIARELDAIRRRRDSAQLEADAELDRLGSFLSVAERAGMRQHEIAERAGVSRQTLINLRNQGRGGDREWNLDLQLLLAMAFDGAQSIAMLGSLSPLWADIDEVEEAVRRLVEAGAIRPAGTVVSGQKPVDYYKISAQGVEQLPIRLRHAAMPPSQRWAAYIATEDADAISHAGETALGEYEVALIPSGTTHDMQAPEVAFYVDAPSLDHAVSAASSRYAELRTLAGLEPEPARITTLLPPDARARNRTA